MSSSLLLETGKDVIKYIPSRIIPALTGFLGVIAFTRLLNPEEYGLYILVMVTISIVSTLIFGWLNQSILRYFEKYKKENGLSKFVSTGVVLLIILLLAVAPIWFIFTDILKEYLDYNLIYLLRIGIAVFAAQTGYSFILFLCQARRQSLVYALYSSINALGVLLLAIVLLYFFNLGVKGMLLANIVFAGGIFCLGLARLSKKWVIKYSLFSKNILAELTSYGIPLIGVSIWQQILSVSDRYMIKYFLGVKAVGIYSAGYSMITATVDSIFGVTLMLAAVPVIVKTFEREGEVRTAALLRELLSTYSVITIPIVFGIGALSKDIVTIFLGEPFRDAHIILPWIAGGIFFWGLSGYALKSFELRKNTSVIFYLIFFASVMNIALNLYLIPRFGILGAGFSTFIAYLIYFITSWVLSKNILPISFPGIALGKAFLAGMAMYITLLFGIPDKAISLPLFIVKIVIGSFIYLAVLTFLKEETFIKVLRYFKRAFREKVVTDDE